MLKRLSVSCCSSALHLDCCCGSEYEILSGIAAVVDGYRFVAQFVASMEIVCFIRYYITPFAYRQLLRRSILTIPYAMVMAPPLQWTRVRSEAADRDSRTGCRTRRVHAAKACCSAGSRISYADPAEPARRLATSGCTRTHFNRLTVAKHERLSLSAATVLSFAVN